MNKQYQDFELEIGEGHGREYPLVVVRSPAGEARATMHFPFDDLALERQLEAVQLALLRAGRVHRRVPSSQESTVQAFGRALFEALLTGEVRSRYDVSCREADQKSQGLRIRLRIKAPELAVLPWEFLYDERQAEYLCLSQKTPIVRYLELPQPVEPLAVTPPLRLLGMVVSPSDLEPLDVEAEKRRVEEATRELQSKGLLEVRWLAGSTWRDLQSAIRKESWHIFHFIGHGAVDPQREEGLVAFADDGDGRSRLLTATDLGRLLADHPPLRLAVLNVCEGARGDDRDVFSSTAATLVRRGVPAVVAMQYEISDRAAIEFARSFYEALADGLPVDASMSEARKAVSIAVPRTLEWATPVLYTHSASGVLFDLSPRVSPSRPTPTPRPGLPPPPPPPLPSRPPPMHGGRGREVRAVSPRKLRLVAGATVSVVLAAALYGLLSSRPWGEGVATNPPAPSPGVQTPAPPPPALPGPLPSQSPTSPSPLPPQPSGLERSEIAGPPPTDPRRAERAPKPARPAASSSDDDRTRTDAVSSRTPGLTASPPQTPPQEAGGVDRAPAGTSAAPLDPGGALEFFVRPWAEVTVDDRSIGQTPLRPLRLGSGKHLVVLKHPDFQPLQKTVVIRANERTLLDIDLRQEAFPK